MGWGFGGRSLNVVVVPALVVLAAAGLLVSRYEEPQVRRDAPTQGHRGETKQYVLTIDAPSTYSVTVTEPFGDGLGGDRTWNLVTDGRDVAHEFDLTVRGRQTIGPTRIVARDPLGLFERVFTHGDIHEVIVFPRLRGLTGSGHLLGDFIGLTDDRDRFDTVREYRPGDPLRDVNWKASAKYPDQMMVTQYAGERAVEQVVVAAEGDEEHLEAVAEAGASIAAFLMTAGLEVGVRTRTRSVPPSRGLDHRQQVFETFALMAEGDISEELLADVDFHVTPGSGESIEVTMENHRTVFDRLVDPTREVALS
jgi:uncharacterized protein (DUF58 family)